MTLRLAIMQPYFLPYAGYFRLFAAADLFVVYDCVQFPRRGFVHRNRLQHESGAPEWLTLPLEKAPQHARIDALRFSPGRQNEWGEHLRHFPAFSSPLLRARGFTEQVSRLEGQPVDYIEGLLKTTCALLDLPFRAARSSALMLPDDVHGQDRILAICEHFRADTYINSPGGRALYDHDTFRNRRIKLEFLPDYEGDMASIAQRMADAGEHLHRLKDEIIRQRAVAE